MSCAYITLNILSYYRAIFHACAQWRELIN